MIKAITKAKAAAPLATSLELPAVTTVVGWPFSVALVSLIFGSAVVGVAIALVLIAAMVFRSSGVE
jgi:ABC-type Co2+ transport system permease subunit